MTIERGETPIAYCSVKGGSLRFDQRFRPFFSHVATMKLLARQQKKSIKYFDLLANLNHSDL